MGELIGGSQREDRLDVLEKRIVGECGGYVPLPRLAPAASLSRPLLPLRPAAVFVCWATPCPVRWEQLRTPLRIPRTPCRLWHAA